MEAAKLNQLKEEINKYSYDEATHKLFAIKGDIVDYKLNIANKESHLKGLKSGKDVKQIARIKDLKIKVEKLKNLFGAFSGDESDRILGFTRTDFPSTSGNSVFAMISSSVLFTISRS